MSQYKEDVHPPITSEKKVLQSFSEWTHLNTSLDPLVFVVLCVTTIAVYPVIEGWLLLLF